MYDSYFFHKIPKYLMLVVNIRCLHNFALSIIYYMSKENICSDYIISVSNNFLDNENIVFKMASLDRIAQSERQQLYSSADYLLYFCTFIKLDVRYAQPKFLQ